MENKKTGCILKILIIFSFFILFAFISIFTYYFITKKNAYEYIPSNFILNLKINSLSKFYNNLKDLKALDIILSNKEFQDIYKLILNFKSKKIAQNKIITYLLNMKADIFLNNNYKPVIIFNLGIKSLLLKLTPLFINLIKENQNYKLESINNLEYNYKYYKLIIKSNSQTFYFIIKNNLIIFALNLNDLNNIYKYKEYKSTLNLDKNFINLKNSIKKHKTVELYFNTNEILAAIKNYNQELRKILNYFNFNNYSVISFNISNENLSLNSFTDISTQDTVISSFLDYNPDYSKILNYIPDNANLLSIIKFVSFEKFYKTFLYVQQEAVEDKIKKINNASKLLLQMDIDELLFSWIGNEIGIITNDISDSPVILIRLKNKNKFNKVVKKLLNTLFFEKDKNLLYEGFTLNKIKFPDFVQSIIYSFAKTYIDIPYYYIIDDILILSMNPSSLSDLLSRNDKKFLLKNDNNFNSIYNKANNKSNILLYFNLANSSPKFFNNNALYSKIIKMYEKGITTFSFNKTKLNLDLATTGINLKKISLYPGYPKKVDNGISSNIYCENISGNNIPEIIYVSEKNQLMINDINNNLINTEPIKLNDNSYENILIKDIDNDGNKEILVFTNNGELYKFDKKGNLFDSYPKDLDVKNSFFPVLYENQLILYSKSKNKLIFYNDSNNNLNDFEFDFDSTLISPLSISKNLFLFYPKSFSGEIYLTDNKGNKIKNWPVKSDGVGFGSPQFIDYSLGIDKKIMFLTQSGNLQIWNYDGTIFTNYPVKLSGSYYEQPAIGNIGWGIENEIAALNSDGLLSIISLKGQILIEKRVKEIASKDSKILLFDSNKDGKDEIFIYYSSNNIYAFDNDLNLMPGYPVKGKSKPSFNDLNFDGEYEMVTSSIDDYLYIYTLPR
ncbi:MAG: DUF3352 domain-containing protein [Spirochaetes bacterium]|nr:DUF3352 domain-containing protein [Spirochaetota bacterium]